MNIESFIKKYRVNKRTVMKWLNDGYIPGAIFSKGMWIIPENARVPYKCSKHIVKPESLYKSFVKAYSQGKNVVPQMYNMTRQKFNLYHKHLINKELIEKEFLDGLVYYNATDKGEEYIALSNTKLFKLFKDFFGLASYIATKAFLESIQC